MRIYDFKVKAQDGSEVSLSDCKGKVLLIVDTDTGCGFTPQYEELQELYDALKIENRQYLPRLCPWHTGRPLRSVRRLHCHRPQTTDWG